MASARLDGGAGSDAQVKVIGKAGKILRVFLTDGPELQLQHLAERAGLDLSTTSRIASSLAAIGVLRYDAVQRLFSPGLALLELSQSVLSRFGFRELAHRELLALSAEHGWACYVGVLADESPGEVMYIDAVTTSPQTSMTAQLGDRRLATSTASGRVLLAMNRSSRQDGERALSINADLRADLDRTARRGYAEITEGDVVGLAFPVFGASGDAVATLGITVNRDGYESQRDWVIATMQAKAKGVSSALELTDTDDVTQQYRRSPRTRVM